MAKIQVSCPKCSARYSVDEADLGKKGRCKRCDAAFVLTGTERTARPSSAGAPAPPQGATYPSEHDVPAVWNQGDLILDRYEVKGLLGEGGMGRVYRVRHRGWNLDLAVKCPMPDYFKTEGQKENFVRECETWINLGLHPHTVSCHYIRNLGGIPRVFAECVEGGSLKEWITSGKLYEGGPDKALERILDIAIQFAWGLHYAHEQGLIHQDVKPANVMMTPDGIAKVTDFGLAKARAGAGEVLSTDRHRSILVSSGGMTPAYCSPEQADKKKLSRKTDVWSWGLSVLEMFTGDVTWMSGVAAADALEGYLEMGTGDGGIPPMPEAVVGLLRRCFERDPAARPHDMREVAGVLKEAWRTLTGEVYARQKPKAVQLRADGLNNRALGLLDLGKPAEAERLWEQAIQADPHHVDVTYNLGLLRWRAAKITDQALLTQLAEVARSRPQHPSLHQALGLVHLERADLESAAKELGEASRLGADIGVQRELERARALIARQPCCVRTFEGHTDKVDVLGLKANSESVFLSADGRWALSGSSDRTLRLWDVSTGQCVRTFEGHTGNVMSVTMSADSRWALSGSSDCTLRLWDVSTGRCMRTFEGHTMWVNSVCFSLDGRFCLSGSGRGHMEGDDDNTLRLWDVSTGRCVRTFEGHTGSVTTVTMSADGRWALSGSVDHTIRLWELDWEYEFPCWADWDEGARPHLETFLTLHTPYSAALPAHGEPAEEEIQRALTRRGRPAWTDADFQQLLTELQDLGYGWLRPEGVRKKLEQMTANWQGPPPLPWQE